MISRRRLLGLAGGIAVIAATSGASFAILKKIVTEEDYIVAVLQHYLGNTPHNKEDLRSFASAYKHAVTVRRKQRVAALSERLYFSSEFRRWLPDQFDAIDRMERLMFSEFLLRTDHFDTARKPGAPLAYAGYDGPIVCNPLARFRDA
jgi:hypothetical protein